MKLGEMSSSINMSQSTIGGRSESVASVGGSDKIENYMIEK
jgi:hypothetical protein